MSEMRDMLANTAGSVFAALAMQSDVGAAWSVIMDAGFPSLLVAEDRGGVGGDWGDAFAVVRLAGFHRLALPLGESMVAASVLSTAGFDMPDGMVGLADGVAGEFHDGVFSGVLHRVPFGRHLNTVIASIDGHLLVLQTAGAVINKGSNLSGEPRDTMRFERTRAASASYNSDLRALGAFTRVALSAGALDAQLQMAIEYVNTRQQFGKPLSKLQAVQQSLAVAAIESAAVNSAGQAAALALDRGPAVFEVAAAKLRSNIAIGQAVGIVHQVHGAIGFTEEYPLHPLTNRLASWRSEFGSDRYWADILGATAARWGGSGFWAELTRRSDGFGDLSHV